MDIENTIELAHMKKMLQFSSINGSDEIGLMVKLVNTVDGSEIRQKRTS